MSHLTKPSRKLVMVVISSEITRLQLLELALTVLYSSDSFAKSAESDAKSTGIGTGQFRVCSFSQRAWSHLQLAAC